MQKVTPHDIRFMRLALRAAEKGRGRVHPNPLVGAVLVKGQKVLAQGSHETFGGAHAEVQALRRAKKIPAGCTLYTTLEPCAHFGKTPPCADLIVSQKISRAVVATKDPNPLVSGRGLRRLKKAGVRVTLGVLEKEARHLNRDFAKWVLKKVPYVTVKVAQSLDGKIATLGGESRWITGPSARRLSHALRSHSDAILVGIHTVLKDDPLLTVRLPGAASQPLKVVLDATLKTPVSSAIFSRKSPAPVLIFCGRRAPASRRRALRRKAEVVPVREKGTGLLDLKDILSFLGRRGIINLLIEGGGEVIASALSQKIVDECFVFVAPKIIGSIKKLSDAQTFRRAGWTEIGGDLLLHGTF